jgi:hypothetical protein
MPQKSFQTISMHRNNDTCICRILQSIHENEMNFHLLQSRKSLHSAVTFSDVVALDLTSCIIQYRAIAV